MAKNRLFLETSTCHFFCIFFHSFFIINVFIETIPRDVFRFSTSNYVEMSKKTAKLKFGENPLFFHIGQSYFFYNFFHSFSSSMYSKRPYPERFFDLSFFIFWKSSKISLKSRLSQKFFRYFNSLKHISIIFFESKTVICVDFRKNEGAINFSKKINSNKVAIVIKLE